jgi:transposase InsO family protein
MIILAHDRRKIIHTAVTGHPTAGWLSRQVTEAFPWDTAPRYLLRDRDGSYGAYFCNRVEAMGITEVVTAPRSPWQNAYVERVIGSIRRECLDHIVIFNERHLRRVRSSYLDYYRRLGERLAFFPLSASLFRPREPRYQKLSDSLADLGRLASPVRSARIDKSHFGIGISRL